MALIRFSNLVNDIRGSSGGNTFSRGLAGATVSMKRTVGVPEGRAFRNGDSLVATMARKWRGLTEAQRLTWRAGAESLSTSNRLGISRSMSGFELFVKASAPRVKLGVPVLPVFTPLLGRPVPSISGLTFSASTIQLAQIPSSTQQLPARTLRKMSGPVSPLASPPSKSALVPLGILSLDLFDRTAYAGGVYRDTFPSLLTSVGSVFWLEQEMVLEDYNWPLIKFYGQVLIVP